MGKGGEREDGKCEGDKWRGAGRQERGLEGGRRGSGLGGGGGGGWGERGVGGAIVRGSAE